MSFGMVSIPVSLYPAVQEKDVRFHQIHRACGSRVKQQKWCPVDECVLEPDEIARAYEVSKGRYVIVEDKDLEALPIPTKHTITVEAFVEAVQIDPVYFDQPYYLEPEETGRKPYALLLKALETKGVAALGKIALRQKESLTLLRPAEGRIVVETLHYPDEIRAMDHQGSETKVDDRELQMAQSLVDLLKAPFQPEKYKDEYREALMGLIEAKAHGEQVRQQPEAPQAEVIDLFEALKRSIDAAKTTKTPAAKPARKKAS